MARAELNITVAIFYVLFQTSCGGEGGVEYCNNGDISCLISELLMAEAGLNITVVIFHV